MHLRRNNRFRALFAVCLLVLLLVQPCLRVKAEELAGEQYLPRRLTQEELDASLTVIEWYLKEFYGAFYQLEMPNLEMVVYNDKTALHLERLRFEIADYIAFGSGYDAIWGEEVTLQSSHIKQNGQYEVTVYFRYDYHYVEAPEDLLSACGDYYTFLLEVLDGEWKITGISAEGDIQYPEFYQSGQIAALTGRSVASCAREAYQRRIDRLPREVEFWKEQNERFAKLAEEQAEELAAQYEEQEEANGSAELQATGKLTYQRVKAVDYAVYYAERAGSPFKRMSADCTNFVSQCIWAGFGGTSGYAVSNQSKLRELINARYRMTDQWYGIASTSSETYPATRFMRVVELWDYTVKGTHTYGVHAAGFNNNKYWHQLTVVPMIGDVLQIFHAGKNRYFHSVIVSKTNSPNLSSRENLMDRIWIASHTQNYTYRSLRDLLKNNGGLEFTKMRLLRPEYAVYTS